MTQEIEDLKEKVSDMTLLCRLNEQALHYHRHDSKNLQEGLKDIEHLIGSFKEEIDSRVERCSDRMEKDMSGKFVTEPQMHKAIAKASTEDRVWHAKRQALVGAVIVGTLTFVFSLLMFLKG